MPLPEPTDEYFRSKLDEPIKGIMERDYMTVVHPGLICLQMIDCFRLQPASPFSMCVHGTQFGVKTKWMKSVLLGTMHVSFTVTER